MPPSSPADPTPVSSPAPPSSSPSLSEHNFESALERLENIVGRMEADRLPLEELLSCYEEGTRLVKVCGEFLAQAEQRIELITRDAQGEPRVVEFNAANVAKLGTPTTAPAVPSVPVAPATPSNHGGPRRSRSAATGPSASETVPSPSTSPSSHSPHEVSLF